MHKIPALYGVIGVSVALAAIPAGAQSGPDLLEQLKIMRQQLEEQRARVDELERQLRASGVAPPANTATAAAPSQLERMRGTGNLPAPQPDAPVQVQAGPLDAPPRLAVPFADPVYPGRLAPLRGTGGGGQAQAGNDAVGRPPAPKTPEVAPIFETPGVLTPRGKVVFEPSVQYGYSSSNRVALVGYTVIPALLIGLLDVREVKRNTTTATATFRYGFDNRLEFEAKIPYVYRSDSTVSRELFTGTAAERAFETSGKGIGDIELGWRYQLNDGGVDTPYYIAGLRFKSRTGRDPFEVVTDCQTRCVGQNVTGTGLPLDLPTGSGFYSVQPSVTWLLPSDPAIFFGGFSYTKNFKRGNVYRTVLNGSKELLGTVEPGDVFGFNFGMGLALNERASFSIGYDHNSVGRMHQNGLVIPGSVRVQLGTLLLGYSYRLKNNRTLSVSVGAGLTRDTPDVTLMVRMPFTF
ncbi:MULTISPECIES: autotransporter outer membrane beta-barrel domain-containing protein [Massilia]|uniref:Autotransporter outer membrane beta-barrel domain-containing protein n=1 Tax=Massilia orientalis TaxID=3050128 RepID=A0ACC7M4L5_9BURK|nr:MULTISPECIES: autotransporter outer membrane beta-barrel domain-containing protein [Telluria group]KQY00716.1 acetate kinase [Massilia sp. Root133]KQZ43280.1 acetate kinase [Massilia sp. Root1485]MDN4045997.1 autotransporter outer membrane beta-barrel domain-containing protein [Massilia sp. YIM B02787]